MANNTIYITGLKGSQYLLFAVGVTLCHLFFFMFLYGCQNYLKLTTKLTNSAS